MKFQAICSKENQKLTLALEATDINAARDILHKQGFSIVELKDADPSITSEANLFYFDYMIDGVLKTGQIQSDDIFKAYRKLVQDIGQEVVYIYTVRGMPEEHKKVITAKVKSGYNLYLSQTQTKEEKADDVKAEEVKSQGSYGDISGGRRKELEKYGMIIDQVITKLSTIIVAHPEMQLDRRTQLEALQQALYQTKASTNTEKLKIITETALIKIGELELEYTKQDVSDEKQALIASTNKLLKQVGSKSRVSIPGEPSLKLPSFLQKIYTGIQKRLPQETQEMEVVGEEEKKEKKKDPLDMGSFVFYKNLRELKIYKNLLKITERELIQATFLFRRAKANKLILKRKLLSQNIQIIENRIANKNFSYTKIVKGFGYYIHRFISIILGLKDLTLFTLLVVSLGILGAHSVFGRLLIRDELIFGATLVSMFIFLVSLVRGIFGVALVVVSFLFYFIFMTVNF